ncbi:MAG TPA: TIM barrel protein [Rectinemataceae bacterium]|nr:TIM barrel protein [Rectinemataceae bacterium]
MIDRNRFALNRITSPSLSLAAFYDLAVSVGLKKVEIRNDLGKADPVDGLGAAAAAKLAAERGLEVVTINALQKFNLPSARAKATAELKALLELASGIGCKAIVLCPNNDGSDKRSAPERLADTAQALADYAPLFTKAGVAGYLEPLGFGISSLASLAVAAEAIARSKAGCYKVVVDTFHFHIGPDSPEVFGTGFPIASAGLVHISGVELDMPKADYRDEHRVLVGPADRMKSKEQILRLEKLGYRGVYSFEPFSPLVQDLKGPALVSALKASLDYLVS